jgi:NADH:ubiquinone oxidoreductase subunit 3 (subunit A)
MQVRSNIIHINRKTFFLILLTLLTFAVATPVLADYLGPDRTVTETTSVSKIVLYECGKEDRGAEASRRVAGGTVGVL